MSIIFNPLTDGDNASSLWREYKNLSEGCENDYWKVIFVFLKNKLFDFGLCVFFFLTISVQLFYVVDV